MHTKIGSRFVSLWGGVAVTLILMMMTTTTTVVDALECNICGPGTQNQMLQPKGVVTINYDGTDRKQNCEKWQDSLMISEEWCKEHILEYTYKICKCADASGVLILDSYSPPTASPAPTFLPPPTMMPTTKGKVSKVSSGGNAPLSSSLVWLVAGTLAAATAVASWM